MAKVEVPTFVLTHVDDEDKMIHGADVIEILKAHKISEKTGFVLENPTDTLPQYFQEWEQIGKSTPILVKCKAIRRAVNEMPELDHESLTKFEDQCYALNLLGLIASCYIWEGVWQGEDGDPMEEIPPSLAVPWVGLSQSLGLNPIVTWFTLILANVINRRDNRELEAICPLPGGPTASYFSTSSALVEIAATPGIKAVVECQNAIREQDIPKMTDALNVIAASIDDMTLKLKSTHQVLHPEHFSRFRSYATGFGCSGSPLTEGLIYRGVWDHPKRFTGPSGAQSPSLAAFDTLLELQHHEDALKHHYENLDYMIRPHREFIQDIRAGPSLREFICDNPEKELRAAYNSCVEAMSNFRTLHLGIATRYVVIPGIKNKSIQSKYLALQKLGSAGNSVMPLLKDVRDTTRKSPLPSPTGSPDGTPSASPRSSPIPSEMINIID